MVQSVSCVAAAAPAAAAAAHVIMTSDKRPGMLRLTRLPPPLERLVQEEGQPDRQVVIQGMQRSRGSLLHLRHRRKSTQVHTHSVPACRS